MATLAVRIQGPRGNAIVGNAVDLARGGLPFLQRCSREYGDLIPLRFFWKPILFVNHPDYIEQVLVTNQRAVVKDIAQRADHALIGEGLFLREGESWLRQRRLMQPAFHRERIASYGEVMVAYTEQMMASWHDGERRDIYREMSHLTMAIVAKTLFGADVWGDADEVTDAMDRALAYLGARVQSLQVLLPASLPTPTNLGLWRARQRIDRVVYRIIRERRADGGDRGDLLSMLFGARGDDGSRMTDRQVRDEVMTILVGGYETATDLLAWVWYLLDQHPGAEAKLLAELDTVLDGRVPTVADLPQLPYVGMVVSETLRLYPPAPALGRETTEAFSLGG